MGTLAHTVRRLRHLRLRGVNTPVLLVALTVSMALATAVSGVQPTTVPTPATAKSAASGESLTLRQPQAASSEAAAVQTPAASTDDTSAALPSQTPSSASLEAQASVSVSVPTPAPPVSEPTCYDTGTCPPAVPEPTPSPYCPACATDTTPGHYRCMIACPVEW
jgi:hypothetical protein